MEITKEQLTHIENYLSASGIKYYDVRTEIADHFATILEQKLAENSNLDFKEEVRKIQEGFSDNGFKKLLQEKTKSVKNRFYKASLTQVFSFFKIPKIIVSVALFYGLFLIMNLFENKENFFSILQGLALLLSFRLLFNVNLRNTKKEQFLALDMTLNFFNVFYFLVLIFQFLDNQIVMDLFGKAHQFFYIIAYLLLFLFYGSSEAIFYQNKKTLKEQYPTILI
jgi:hypothetical protein